MRVSYTFIDTISESDGECGGGGSVTTPPDRGPGYEGKSWVIIE